MPTLLLEIGCEELPGLARAARPSAQLPRARAERAARRSRPTQVYVGPRRLAVRRRRRCPSARRRVGQGAAGRAARAAPRPGLREAARRRRRTSSRSATASSASTRAGRAARRGRCPSGSTRSSAGSRSARRCAGTTSGLRFSRPVRWLLREARRRDASTGFGAASYGPPLHARRGRGRRDADELPRGAARGATSSPTQHERRRRIVDGARRARRLERPARQARRGRAPRRVADRARGARSTSGSSQLPERVIVTAMQSHQRYFPLGGNRVRGRRERRRPERRARGQRARARGAARGRGVHLRARRRARDRGARAASSGRSRSSPGAGTFADKTERLVELVDAARRRRGDARGGAAREGRPGRRARARVPRARGLHRRRVRAARRLPGGGRDGDRGAVPAGRAPTRRCPQTERGRVLAAADKIDKLDVAFALGHRPTGSRDPYGLRRAAIGLCRLAVEGGLAIDRATCSRTTCATSSRSGSRASSTCPSSTCAPRGPRRAPTSAASRALAQALCAARETPELDGVYTAYTRAHRLAGKAAATRPSGRPRPAARRTRSARWPWS